MIILFKRIAAAMRAAGVRPRSLAVPEPLQRWFSADRWLPGALLAAEPPPEAAGATRALDPEPLRPVGAL